MKSRNQRKWSTFPTSNAFRYNSCVWRYRNLEPTEQNWSPFAVQ